LNNSLKQKYLEESASIETKELYRGKVFSLVTEKLKFENLEPHVWDTITHPGAVAILPIKENGNLILIQQWRRPIGKIIYEIPAGTLNKGEPIEEAAVRELQEEVGLKPETLIPFGGAYSAPGFCTEYVHLFLAKDLVKSSLPKDKHEAIDVVDLSLEEALELIDDGSINDAKTILSLLRYQRWLDKKNHA